MSDYKNPFRPGAGHTPPYLAGRLKEKNEFSQLLSQEIILENAVLTGLRGVGKTVLLEAFKPIALKNNWLWVGTDLSETSSISEDNMSIRICTDLSIVTSRIVIKKEEITSLGFHNESTTKESTLNFQHLFSIYKETPGLASDKLKHVLSVSWRAISAAYPNINGIVFSYDEAQNLSDQADKEQYPLSLLLDTFQSLQRQGMPLMLALTGLPTLFPKLVEARTYSERMFHVLFLNSLTDEESREAILKPIDLEENCPINLSENSVKSIIDMSGGYPYFIQFICREVFDTFLQMMGDHDSESMSIPRNEIEQKLDTDFFAGRWARCTDRQRELLSIIASLKNPDNEFTVQEVCEMSASASDSNPFSSSHVNQMLSALSKQGLVFKNRHGKYSFAVPLMERFIQRQFAF